MIFLFFGSALAHLEPKLKLFEVWEFGSWCHWQWWWSVARLPPIYLLFACKIFLLPVPVPELFCKYPTRPVPKSKTPTRRTLLLTLSRIYRVSKKKLAFVILLLLDHDIILSVTVAVCILDNDLVEFGLQTVFKSWQVFQKLWGRPMPKTTRTGSGASCSLK